MLMLWTLPYITVQFLDICYFMGSNISTKFEYQLWHTMCMSTVRPCDRDL